MASLVTYLADALPGRLPGVRITILDTYGPGRFWLMPPYFVLAVLRVAILRIKKDIDLLHVHMACYGSAVRKAILIRAANFLRVKTIIHIHGADFDDYFRALPAWKQAFLTSALQCCIRVVVIGHHWREFVRTNLHLEHTRIVLIHNGAPLSAIEVAARKANGTVKILMLGELGPRKGTPDLLSALASAEVKSREWSAVLAGNGAVDVFRAEVEQLGLSDRVSLPGWQSTTEVRVLLADADILVLPSYQEGLPMAIIEAMASGATVVSTPVGAIPDAITNGETGVLVPAGDISALSRALLQLIDDPYKRAYLAANARRRFEEMFTIDKTADDVAAMYRELGIT